jgi:tRNA A-37 threonylcarbamoyl transferase component Bud32
MKFLLSSQNVADYLGGLGLCAQEERIQLQIEPVPAKNFNMLVKFPDGRKLLVKQERYGGDGKAAGEFVREARIQEFFQEFPEVGHIRPLLPVVLHFDAKNYILVVKYQDGCRDLSDLYGKANSFPLAIAEAIGTQIATLHRDTFNRHDYRDFLSQKCEGVPLIAVQYLADKLERVEPEIFGQVPPDVLKFIALYQRYDSLGQAVGELAGTFAPCCLMHNDLKLNNILLNADWEQCGEGMVRFIDWERSDWGEPASDLGTLIASYLLLWLNSMVISRALSIEESLRLATIPLEQIQPSIAALTQSYFNTFPEILQARPDFLRRVVQFAGFGLIQQVMAMLQNQASLGNMGIGVLQVAKSLLCRPEQSVPTIFGKAMSPTLKDETGERRREREHGAFASI